MARRLRAVLALLAVVLLSSACRVDVEVGINAETDGSGRVLVVADREVAEAVDLSAGVRVEDLKQAGWTIDGPDPRPDGGVQVVATKPFADADEAQKVVQELSGPDGPFQEFRLERERSFAKTTTRFSGQVDFAKGIE